MAESRHESVTNESTNSEVDAKEMIENDDVSSISTSAADLCELKQINCEVGAKNTPESCHVNACKEEQQSKENENSSKESQDERKIDENSRSNSISQEDQQSNIERTLDNNKETAKEHCQSPTKLSQQDQQNNTECYSLESKEAESTQCCQIPANSKKLKQCCQSPSRTKELTSGKPKRKSRSTRRRLNAMISNSSLHFSDTDSEGELVIMESHMRGTSPAKLRQGPVISVTMEDIENADKGETNSQCLAVSTSSEVNRSRRGSFTENFTDVDEIYTSEPENEQKAEMKNGLAVAENALQADTDVEDLSNDEGEPTIYVSPRSDILNDFSGETITTKEGDGPFSVEIRNRMSKEIETEGSAAACKNSPDIVVMPTTDSEDMEMSDEENLQEASCSQRYLFEDLDVLAASQIVMTNVNKTTDTLSPVKDTQDDVSIGDNNTDIEDVDCAE